MNSDDNDSRHITESVGATALGVAAVQAAETNRDNPLIRDHYAHLLLEGAGHSKEAIPLSLFVEGRLP
jgi:O-methyltransferase involved in polyketide biosynthesis